MTPGTRIIVAIATTLIFALSGGVTLGFFAFAVALCLVSTLHLLTAIPTLSWGLPQSYVCWVFPVACLVSSLSLNRCEFSLIKGLKSDSQDLLILIFGSLLILRWKVFGFAHVLGVLKAEDNGRWIMAASNLSSYSGATIRPDSSAGGGYLLDYLIGVVRFITVGGSARANSDPATSYLVIMNCYYIVLLIAFVAIGCFASTSLRKFGLRKNYIIAPLGTLFLLAPTMFRIFINYGHLSLLVAILFFWLTCLLLLSMSEGLASSFLRSCLVGLVALGIMGGWWPAIPLTIVVLVSLLLCHAHSSIFTRFRLIKFILGLLFILILLLLLLTGDKAISNFRAFYTASGGAITFDESNLALCFIGLATFIYLFSKITTKKFIDNLTVIPFIASGFYAIFLLLSSQFVGPNFFAGYSANKVLAFFIIVSLPLLLISGIAIIQQSLNFHGAVLSIFFIYLVTSIGFGSNWNFPRPIAEPIWAQTLIDVVRNYPGSPIVCVTSQEELRMEAYVCSRHASSISNRNTTDNFLHGRNFEYIWRTLIVTPRSLVDRESFPISEEFRLFQDDPNYKVPVAILLNSEFGIMQADSWWMENLPWEKFLIIQAETGKQIDLRRDKLLFSTDDALKVEQSGTAKGFIDKITVSKGVVTISGWADFGQEVPHLIIRNAQSEDVLNSRLYIRPDIANPTVRGFEFSYAVGTVQNSGYCPILAQKSDFLSFVSSDPRC